jgi:hypothetical protein
MRLSSLSHLWFWNICTHTSGRSHTTISVAFFTSQVELIWEKSFYPIDRHKDHGCKSLSILQTTSVSKLRPTEQLQPSELKPSLLSCRSTAEACHFCYNFTNRALMLSLFQLYFTIVKSAFHCTKHDRNCIATFYTSRHILMLTRERDQHIWYKSNWRCPGIMQLSSCMALASLINTLRVLWHIPIR